MEGFIHKSTNWFIQFDLHDALFLHPGALVPAINIEGDPLVEEVPNVLHFAGGRLSWGPTYYHKDNDDLVVADSARVISRAHRVRMTIFPHKNILPPSPTNMRMTALILRSDNKCEMAAASVVGPDGPIAVAVLRWVGINMACNEPCMLPSSFCFTGGTVLVGYTLGDLLAAILMGLLDALLDGLVQKLGDATGGWLGKKLGVKIATLVLEIVLVTFDLAQLPAAIAAGPEALVAWFIEGLIITGVIGLLEVGELLADQLGLTAIFSAMGADIAQEALAEALSRSLGLGLSEATDGEYTHTDELFTPLSDSIDTWMTESELLG